MGLGKARTAAAEPWKLKLYDCPIHDWAQAQMYMDNIIHCTGQRPGKLNGKIQPRACTGCGRWGHTKQYCQIWRAVYEAKFGEPYVRSQPKEEYIPLTKEEHVATFGEQSWWWVCEFRRLDRRCRASHGELGGGVYDSDKWNEFCAAYDCKYPAFPEGVPSNSNFQL